MLVIQQEPAMQILGVRAFSDRKDYLSFSVARINNNSVKQFGGRGNWVRICNTKNGATIFRMVRGSSPQFILNKEQLEIDYDGILELGITSEMGNGGFRSCDILVETAKRHEQILAHWNHPDPGYQLPFRISMMSLMIGILGFLGGIIEPLRHIL